MCFTFKKSNKQTKKPLNCFLQDDASAGIQSLQTFIEIKLCQNPWNGLWTYAELSSQLVDQTKNWEMVKSTELFLSIDRIDHFKHFKELTRFPAMQINELNLISNQAYFVNGRFR